MLQARQADMFIGYQSYAPMLEAVPGFVTLSVPPPCQVHADYAFALCSGAAQPLAAFLRSVKAQKILQEGEFSQ
ncbi:substrate-binding domain-containing protein [Pantoea sp. FN060301]|uniref:substrate-binding domain-containing protein n=1 Tax=Pantoea sp. FN060301 TaxID=3420380 RepID=UPI003D18180A